MATQTWPKTTQGFVIPNMGIVIGNNDIPSIRIDKTLPEFQPENYRVQVKQNEGKLFVPSVNHG